MLTEHLNVETVCGYQAGVGIFLCQQLHISADSPTVWKTSLSLSHSSVKGLVSAFVCALLRFGVAHGGGGGAQVGPEPAVVVVCPPNHAGDTTGEGAVGDKMGTGTVTSKSSLVGRGASVGCLPLWDPVREQTRGHVSNDLIPL